MTQSLVLALLLRLVALGGVQGTVRDAHTGEAVPMAQVEVDGEPRALTDARGYFMVVGLDAGSHELRIEAVGYEPLQRSVRLGAGEALSLRLPLEPSPLILPGLGVAAERRGAAAGAGPSPVILDRLDVDVLPALGEPDVFRTIQTLPAVQSASDFSSALYTRGGSPDQTIVLLDGAPLFNPFHLGGVFAAIDPDAVATVEVIPGGMGASEPDRLSGVVKIHTRDGSRGGLHGRGGVGLVSSRVSLDGPLADGRGSWLVAGRRTYIDVVSGAAAALGLVERGVPYGFYDALGKVSFDIGQLGRLSGFLYLNRELLRPESDPSRDPDAPEVKDRFRWGTFAGSVSYTQPIGRKVTLTATAAFSRFATDLEIREVGPETEPAIDTRANFSQVLSKADVTWYASGGVRVHAGLKVDHFASDHRIGGRSHTFRELFEPLHRVGRLETLAAYLEPVWSPFPRLQVRAGLRVLTADGIGPELQPRAGARWEVAPDLAFTASVARYAQPVYSIRNEESLGASYLAYDLLEAVPARRSFQTAREVVVGGEWSLRALRVRVDAYAKDLDHLLMPPLPDNPFGAPVIADSVTIGTGSAYGIELMARHDAASWGAQLGYAWSRATRRQAGLEYTPRFSRSHVVDLTAHHAIGETGRVTVRAVGGTGQPYTRAVGSVHVFRPGARFRGVTSHYDNIILLGRHNAARLPGYLRLDVGFRKTFEKHWFGREVTLTPYGQILNVLNTRNVVTVEPTPAGLTVAPNELRYPPQLPFLPTFGVEWQF